MATLGRARAARRPLILALSVLTTAGLGACGSDSPKTTTAASGSAAPTQGNPDGSTSTTTAPCTFSGATEKAQGNSDAPGRLLTDVRVGSHGCYERVTFELKPRAAEADGPVAWKARYEKPPITEDGSGKTVAVKGDAFLVITMSASGADLTQESAPDTYTGPTSLSSADATRIQQVRRIGDFEGVLSWVIGLDKQRPFKVTTETGPARVIVDVGD